MQHAVVEICISIPLGPHDLLDTVVTPARPAVGGEHDLSLLTVFVKRHIDLLGPLQGVAHQSAAKGVDVVNRGHDVLGRPECLKIRKPGVHLRWRLGARRVLELHADAVDGERLKILFNNNRGRDQP